MLDILFVWHQHVTRKYYWTHSSLRLIPEKYQFRPIELTHYINDQCSKSTDWFLHDGESSILNFLSTLHTSDEIIMEIPMSIINIKMKILISDLSFLWVTTLRKKLDVIYWLIPEILMIRESYSLNDQDHFHDIFGFCVSK